jgi:hypothetical protein
MNTDDHRNWDWRRDFERQFGAQPDRPGSRPDPISNGAPADDAPEERGPASRPPVSSGDRQTIALPDPLLARLVPEAEARGLTVETLVIQLLQAELDGDLIACTLDEEPASPGGGAVDASADGETP